MAALHTAIYWIALFILCGGCGIGWVASQGMVDFVRKVRSRRRLRRSLWIEQYDAEQAIRRIRREAICDMLDAEPGGDVIEGTAVEVTDR
jgi:hypothetical protein